MTKVKLNFALKLLAISCLMYILSVLFHIGLFKVASIFDFEIYYLYFIAVLHGITLSAIVGYIVSVSRNYEFRSESYYENRAHARAILNCITNSFATLVILAYVVYDIYGEEYVIVKNDNILNWILYGVG